MNSSNSGKISPMKNIQADPTTFNKQMEMHLAHWWSYNFNHLTLLSFCHFLTPTKKINK